MFLLDAEVLGSAGHPQARQVAIKRKAAFSIANNDRGVVDAEEEAAGWLLPLGISLAGREPNNFQDVIFRIPEIKGFDAAGVFVPVGHCLRTGGDLLNVVTAQLSVRFV